MSENPAPPLTLQALPELRRRTDAVSHFLRQQLVTHLDTLRPILTPERIFGRQTGSKTELTVGERALADLQQQYRPFTGKPYNLSADFSASWVAPVGNALDLHPWDYPYEIGGKVITITSPVRWIASFRSSYTPAQVRQVLVGKETAHLEQLRQFVVDALVLQILVARTPGLLPLFADLRHELKTETPPDLHGLPLLVITSCLQSFRPADDLIEAATAFSGVPAFIELVPLDAIASPKDALKDKLRELFQG